MFPTRKNLISFPPTCNTLKHSGSGVTLVELLVVIGIIVAMMAVAVPVVRLATDGNKVSTSSDQVVSFINSVKAAAQNDGKSYLIFERNHNAPNLCYRMYRGKPRPDYRGEDQTAYAVHAGTELIDVGTPDNLTMACDVFYLYNADVNKVSPFQYISLDGRSEKYEIVKARTYNVAVPSSSDDVFNAEIFRPVVKVFTLRNSAGAGLTKSPLVHLNGTAINSQAGPWSDWNAAFTQDSQCEFWPNSPIWLDSSTGYNAGTDIPNAGVRTFEFSITQPPYIDELDRLELTDGLAIHLNGCGFDVDGRRQPQYPISSQNSFFAYTQFAWPNDSADAYADSVMDFWALEENANAQATLQAETQFPVDDAANNYQINIPIDSQLRTSYFPMIEFNSRGRIERVFACSPFLSAVFSHEQDVVRSTPFQPSTPLFLLMGKDVERGINMLVAPDDYWISANQMTGRVTKFKAEDNPGDIDGDGFVTVRDSRLVSIGGVSE